MAPIKAVLRSKLHKADTAKSLMELVDRYDTFSEGSCDTPNVEEPTSDSEVEMTATRLPTLFASPMTAASSAAASVTGQQMSSLELHRLQLQFMLLYGQLAMQQQQQQQQYHPQQLKRHLSAEEASQEQPLNLTFNPLKRPAAAAAAAAAPVIAPTPNAAVVLADDDDYEDNEDEDDAFSAPEFQPKRICLQQQPQLVASASMPVSPAAPVGGHQQQQQQQQQQRRRKRSYRLSDNAEIRAYQTSAPELFAWDGHKPMIHQFLLKLLSNPSCCGLIRWLDQDARLFKVLQPGSVARLWQFIKGNRTDNYECFARGIRHSRDIGKYFEAHEFRKKKVYKFAEKALRPVTAADRQREQQQQQQPAHNATRQPSVLSHQQDIKPRVVLDESFRSADVLAKLKSALAERKQSQQQQQQQHQQPQQLSTSPSQLQPKLEVTEDVSDVDEDDSSPLVIADCEFAYES